MSRAPVSNGRRPGGAHFSSASSSNCANSAAHRDTDRAMVTAHNVGVDCRRLHRGAKALRYQHVVDSPSDVAGAGIGERAPPGVVAVALREQPESIDETRFEHVLETLALLQREALLALVGFGIGEVEFGMRH